MDGADPPTCNLPGEETLQKYILRQKRGRYADLGIKYLIFLLWCYCYCFLTLSTSWKVQVVVIRMLETAELCSCSVSSIQPRLHPTQHFVDRTDSVDIVDNVDIVYSIEV